MPAELDLSPAWSTTIPRRLDFSAPGSSDCAFPSLSPFRCDGLRCLALILIVLASCRVAAADGLERMRSSGRLVYGSDMEGGGPYAYPDPRSPREVTGFEVELMARLAQDLGVRPPISRRASGTSCCRCSTPAGSTWSSTVTNGPRRGPATTWRPGRTTSISCN